MTRRGIVAAVLAVLSLSACSTTTDVTQSGGEPVGQAAAETEATPQDSGDVPDIEPVSSPNVLDCPDSDLAAQERDDGLPAVTLPCLSDGSPVNLAGLTGKPTVLNVWASWCPPCTEELPALAEFSTEYGDQVRVLGVDLLDSSDAAAATLENLGVELATVADPNGQVKAELGVLGPPVTFFLSSDGVVKHRVDGALPEAGMWADLAEEHLLDQELGQ